MATSWVKANLPLDPQVLDFVTTPLGALPVSTPGTTAGVQVGSVTVDPTYTMPFNGNQLPLVFDLPITNTGPSTDTFNIGINNASAGFRVYPSIGSLTLQGGQSGMVNVCVVPNDLTGDSIAPAGSGINYSVNVTSATNSSVSATSQPSFNSPRAGLDRHDDRSGDAFGRARRKCLRKLEYRFGGKYRPGAGYVDRRASHWDHGRRSDVAGNRAAQRDSPPKRCPLRPPQVWRTALTTFLSRPPSLLPAERRSRFP